MVPTYSVQLKVNPIQSHVASSVVHAHQCHAESAADAPLQEFDRLTELSLIEAKVDNVKAKRRAQTSR